MTPISTTPSASTPARVGTPEYARLRAQASGFQFVGTLVTQYFSTVDLAGGRRR